MKAKLMRSMKFVTVVAVLGLGAYFSWRSTATLIPDWTSYSPDSRFRIEFYSVWIPRHLGFTMPGGGSDNVDGFIRLYNANGKIVNEVFRTLLRDYEAHWT